jgi:methylated-DNA-[protein]-cysteine S-methyltransferase
MTTTEFSEKIYALLRTVPKGKVTTYKELANALNTAAYRAVGQVMKNNPYAPSVPCHRVVSSSGEIGGFSGVTTGPDIVRKKKMLESEGIRFIDDKIIDFEKVIYRF